VTGTVTKIAPFGAFARIEDGIEGLIHQSELPQGVDPKTVLHEGAQLQLRILRIDAERRRLGLSLRQTDETAEAKEAAPEGAEETGAAPAAPVAAAPTPEKAIPSLESTTPSLEAASQLEHAPRRERTDRRERERTGDNSALGGLSDDGELTAMAEAFRAARQRTKEETDNNE